MFWRSVPSFQGKRVVLTGPTGAFGLPLQALLRKEGVAEILPFSFQKDWDYQEYSAFDAVFPTTDIFILAHGSKVEQAMEANCFSFVELIERYKRARQPNGRPEIWAVGSEIESHPHWGNPDLKIYKASKDAYARFARMYYHDPTILYRHIVPAAFSSRMGPGLISGQTAARIALFFIKCGFRYVPVTYTGIACFNFFKFLFRYRCANPSDIPTLRIS